MSTSERRPESMFTSPVNWPAACTTIGTSPPVGVGCAISIRPAVTTKNGTWVSPASTSTSPAATRRTRPRAATRAICAGVRTGNAASMFVDM